MTQSEYTDATSSDFVAEAEKTQVSVKVDEPGTLTVLPPDSQANQEQWRKIGERVSLALAELPDYVSEFFNEYQRPIVTIGLLVGALITVKVTLAILDALNDIPLLAPTFELIGIGYSAWFIYRYLLKASNRRELTEEFNTLKEQVVGGKNGSNS